MLQVLLQDPCWSCWKGESGSEGSRDWARDCGFLATGSSGRPLIRPSDCAPAELQSAAVRSGDSIDFAVLGWLGLPAAERRTPPNAAEAPKQLTVCWPPCGRLCNAQLSARQPTVALLGALLQNQMQHAKSLLLLELQLLLPLMLPRPTPTAKQMLRRLLPPCL